MADSDLAVRHTVLHEAGGYMDDIAAKLGYLRGLISDHTELPFLAFGSVGEPARSSYERSRTDELANLDKGVGVAQTFADNLHKTGATYLNAQDANVKALLYEIGWGPGPDGKLKPASRLGITPPTPNPPPTPTTDLFNALPQPVTVGVQAARSAGLAASGARLVSKLSWSTLTNLKRATTLSSFVVVAGLWATVVWSDDDAVDTAIRTWEEVAEQSRAIFGSDVDGLRRALKTAWHGTAAISADGRILEFIIAGMALADRAEKRVAELRDLIDQLRTIFTIAFAVSVYMIATSVICMFALEAAPIEGMEFVPWFFWAVAFIGGVFGSYGLIALSSDAGTGFEMSGTDSGSAAAAVPQTFTGRRGAPAPPAFSF